MLRQKLVSLFLIVTSSVLFFVGCGPRRGLAQSASDPGPGITIEFDSREFLCRFSGGSMGAEERGSAIAGRRYTPEERTRARALIAVELSRLGLVPYEHNYTWLLSDQQWISPDYREAGYAGSGVNLLAELPATVSSDRWILVGAHYDSVDTSPGADDNASGVTAVLLVAGELTALETRRVNILFAFFDQEEEGLIGSHALVREFNVNQRLVSAVHIMDMIGWDQDDDRIVEVAHCGMPEAPNDTMMQLYTHAARRLAWNSSGITIGGLVRTESCSSDHVFFAEDGIPAVQLGEEFSGRDMTPYYHQPQDTCATIDFTFFQSVAALVAEAVTIQME